MQPIIKSGVKLGKNYFLEEHVILGAGEERLGPLLIGDNAIIRSGTIIYYGTKIGNNFTTGHYAIIRERNMIGDNVVIGSHTELAPGNTIGNYTTIHSKCFLERVSLGEFVFIAPGVTFLDDKYPVNPDSTQWRGAVVSDDVVIGGGSTIGPWTNIGKNSLIGMGSIVCKDIPEGEVWIGNPARFVKKSNIIFMEEKSDGIYVPGNRRRYKK